MGFFESYKRLTKKQKIYVGMAGIVVGLIGPYATTFMQSLFDEEERKYKLRRENLSKAHQQTIDEGKMIYNSTK